MLYGLQRLQLRLLGYDIYHFRIVKSVLALIL